MISRMVRLCVARIVIVFAQALVLLWRWSCRRAAANDPRPTLRAKQQRYVYALLHEHQLAAVIANDEPQMAAMVSRSRDGDVLAAALRVTGVFAVRGSSQSDARNKGGQQALRALIARVDAGEPALIAVDGPRGPRGRVRKGIVALARASHAVILPVVVEASVSARLKTTWDRPLIPLPLSRVRLHFGTPLVVEAQAGQDTAICAQLSASLLSLATQTSRSQC